VATRETGGLTEIELDLRRYAEDKLGKAMEDVVQSFTIAGKGKEGPACLAALMLRACGVVAVASDLGRPFFLQMAGECYDQCLAKYHKPEE